MARGVAGRAGDDVPLALPVPLLELGPGEDTTVLYVGGGGGGGVALCPNPKSLGDAVISNTSSLTNDCSAIILWTSSRLSGEGIFRHISTGGGGGGEEGSHGLSGSSAEGYLAIIQGAGTGEIDCGEASENLTHLSSEVTATDLGDSTGPKILSKSFTGESCSSLSPGSLSSTSETVA